MKLSKFISALYNDTLIALFDINGVYIMSYRCCNKKECKQYMNYKVIKAYADDLNRLSITLEYDSNVFVE